MFLATSSSTVSGFNSWAIRAGVMSDADTRRIAKRSSIGLDPKKLSGDWLAVERDTIADVTATGNPRSRKSKSESLNLPARRSSSRIP
jgi:hypothetical protein